MCICVFAYSNILLGKQETQEHGSNMQCAKMDTDICVQNTFVEKNIPRNNIREIWKIRQQYLCVKTYMAFSLCTIHIHIHMHIYIHYTRIHIHCIGT